MTRRIAVLLFAVATTTATAAAHGAPWPGGVPVDVTPAAFGNNVSGATWNPLTGTLWTVENSPGIIRKSVFNAGTSSWSVTASWQPGSDLESIAVRLFTDTSIFVAVERDANNHRLIREYETAPFALVREWDLLAMLSGPANDGLEALTFVPDSALAAMHFVNAAGQPYESSQFGTGGLFFAGHQDTGNIFVFDLNRSGTGTNRPHVHVTTMVTGQSEIAALEFDRSNGLLYAWHDDVINKLQVFHSDGNGHFTGFAVFDNPFCCDWNIEGLAIVDDGICGGRRSLLFTRDQALVTDPSLYEDTLFPCDCNGNAVADAIDIQSASSPDQNGNGIPDECETVVTAAGDPDLTGRGVVLHGAAPNPFNPGTTIVFELPAAAPTTVAIYDIAGHHVRTLVHGALPAGRHELRWDAVGEDGGPVASGVYFCRLQSASNVQMRRLVCVR